MKILVLNGSPKREHSDTLHITQAFLEGMNEVSHHDIHIIHVIDSHINYCTGCFSCMKNGGTCIHEDDMSGILADKAEKALDSHIVAGIKLNASSKNSNRRYRHAENRRIFKTVQNQHQNAAPL